ncbi:heat-inducible transcription repressor [Campylobacter blaseri]|uniref:HrcA family transcriptional regulator n=1 Tax=Campylobacter blaseri TaxID=2042961 RepID=A0A2P8R233_9BACT|nr:HrcA family transcriptional regulator [Campylobacter blaseri]PSM52557.1 HrcA family transcriptional regulator [Campylobacter blaseri]PSM54205.1 HrcA family transcriptional regulator [Campylobacter blaseri]QKF85856.1 heat-inducible transcription repressor [Campylobacter blaseri]
MKLNKRDLILDYIIEAYLDENTPIGSTELGLRMDGLIPASTIRVYFKKLNDEGAIKQLHVSSGRIPTTSTMKKYWLERLDLSEKIDINDEEALADVVSKFNIYCMIFSSDYEILEEVINHKDRFIILSFDKGEIILKFNSKVYSFLSNLIGIELSALEKISIQIGLSELRTKIRELKNSKIEFIANETVAYKIFNDERFKMLLNPSITTRFNQNIIFSPIFDKGFMGIKRDVVYKNSDATMLCAGSVYEDYEKFFNNIMEAA